MSGKRVSWTAYAFPIQNQGSCGSCTAYMSTSVTEGVTRIKYGKCPKLSEKDALNCAGGSCQYGNTMANALNKALRGIATLECCPDAPMPSGQDSPCGANRCAEWWLTGVKIGSWKAVTGLENVKAILDKGPIGADFQVPQSFLNYLGGVWKRLGDSDPIRGGHAVSLWGYDDGQQCFLGRNSWGPEEWGEKPWGEEVGDDGWFRVAYTEIPTCTFHFFEVVANGTVAPDPAPVCGVSAWIVRHFGWKTLHRLRMIRQGLFGIRPGCP